MFRIDVSYALTDNYFYKRGSVVVTFSPSLNFSDARNSQYYRTLIH